MQMPILIVDLALNVIIFFISRVLNLIVLKKMDHFGPLCLRHKYKQETETKKLNKISDCYNIMLFVLKNKIPGILRI